MNTTSKIILSICCLCTVLASFCFVGCSKKSKTLEIVSVSQKFNNSNLSFTTVACESYPADNNGMVGTLTLQIGETDAPEEYIMIYFFASADNAKNYLEQEDNNKVLKLAQQGYSSNGVTTTFGTYYNVVYLATSNALQILMA